LRAVRPRVGGGGGIELLGPEDLAIEPVALERGAMVLWDATVPHHNLPTVSGARYYGCAKRQCHPANYPPSVVTGSFLGSTD
jgi:hypothetical protein